jgi:glutamate carboxypeptidase
MSVQPVRSLLEEVDGKRDALLAALDRLVTAESPSVDADALHAAADVLADIGRELLGVELERGEVGSVPYLAHTPSGPSHVALIGHFDTVWPLGTVVDRPFRVEGDWVYGPGILDMKCGIVQGLGAVSTVGLEGVTLLFTADEELGSPSSRALIEETARRVPAVLVLEPAAGEAVKVARKGCAIYELEFHGREAHAGLEPEQGVNATLALAHAAIGAAGLAADAAGTTVTPTTATAGTAFNTVPGGATLHVDVRAWTDEELARVDGGLRHLRPGVAGAGIDVRQGPVRPPLREDLGRGLLDLAQRESLALGIGPLETARVGGGSDGSFTAGVGTPTLDGLGAVGAGAHAQDERVRLSSIVPRTALVGALVEALRSERS